MTNKTQNYRVATKRPQKNLIKHLYVLLPFAYKWLPIFNYVRMRQTAPCKVGTVHRKFWEKDD